MEQKKSSFDRIQSRNQMETKNVNFEPLLKRPSFSFLFLGVLLATCASLSGEGISSGSTTYVSIKGSSPPAESILSAALPTARGVVNRFDRTIHFYLTPNSDLTKLSPNFVTAPGVAISTPASGPLDLTNPVTLRLSDGSVYTVQAFDTSPSAAAVDAWLGSGVNLGNDLDAWPGAEGSWTNGVTAQKIFFDDYKNMGFQSVRIPVTWGEAKVPSDRLDSVPPFLVNPNFLARVDTVAGWGIDAGLTVVINAHHEDWIRTLTGDAYRAQKPRFEALWTQIARHFQNWPPQLVFEILNEPHNSMTNADLNDLNLDILRIIRGSGGLNATRTVILGANSYNSISALQDGVFSVPSPTADPHIIVTFHNYNPWNFAGQSVGTWGSAADINQMNDDLTKVAAWAKTKGVPLYMGEYGVTFQYQGARTDLTSRAAWYKNVYQAAKSRGIAMAIWDDYGDFKIYDRKNRTYDKSVVPVVAAP